MRWTVAVSMFFLTIFAMNAVFIYAAVSGREPVAASYTSEHR